MRQEFESEDEECDARPPIWETVVMAASFILLWVWFLARQSTLKAGTTLSPLWYVLLFGVLITLFTIMVRRVKRVRRALEENDPRRTTSGFGHGAPMPFGFTPPSSPTKSQSKTDGKTARRKK